VSSPIPKFKVGDIVQTTGTFPHSLRITGVEWGDLTNEWSYGTRIMLHPCIGIIWTKEKRLKLIQVLPTNRIRFLGVNQ